MKKQAIIILAIVLIVVLAAGVIGWSHYGSSQNKNKPAAAISVEQIRDRAIAYIAANHTDTVQAMTNLQWSGGRQQTGLLGADNYLYTSGDWTVQIQNPVVLNPTYTINATYCSQNGTVNWIGTYSNGSISETNQEINITSVLSTPEQVRDVAMLYIAAYHNQTASYMQNLTWGGGDTTPTGLVGSETYTYQTQGNACWKVVIQYPVVLNPIYSINATYTQNQKATVTWQGTLQSGVTTETTYKYNP